MSMGRYSTMTNKGKRENSKRYPTIKKADNRYVIGLATGDMDQLDAIASIKDLFEIKILINGAVAYYHNEFIWQTNG